MEQQGTQSCRVYWVHLPEHSDITAEGYVGITTRSVRMRMTEHVRDAEIGSNLNFHKAIRKYGDRLVTTTLVVGSKEYCLLIENKLRPDAFIGWNVAVGGCVSCPPSDVRWKSPESRKKHSQLMQAKGFHPTTKTALAEYLVDTPPWKRGSAVKATWLQAGEIYVDYCSGVDTYYKINKKFGVSQKSAKNLIKHFKNGWNPLNDHEWLEWTSAENNLN